MVTLTLTCFQVPPSGVGFLISVVVSLSFYPRGFRRGIGDGVSPLSLLLVVFIHIFWPKTIAPRQVVVAKWTLEVPVHHTVRASFACRPLRGRRGPESSRDRRIFPVRRWEAIYGSPVVFPLPPAQYGQQGEAHEHCDDTLQCRILVNAPSICFLAATVWDWDTALGVSPHAGFGGDAPLFLVKAGEVVCLD